MTLTETTGPHFWDGTMPTATTAVAKECDTYPKAQQEVQATRILDFINDNDSFHDFNSERRLVPFLIIVPGNSKKVRVVYGIGTGKGTNGLEPAAIDHNIMALMGDVTPTSYPNTLTLPPDTLELRYVNIADEEEVLAKMESVAESTRNPPTFWFKGGNVKSQVPLPFIVPILAYMV